MHTTTAVTETRPAILTYLRIDTPTKEANATPTGDNSQGLRGTESDGFTAVDYYMSYNACSPPAWITSNPLYDQFTGLPPSVTAGGEITPLILEEPGGVAQRGNDAPFPSASPPNNTREAFPPTDTRVISVESNKQSDTPINVSAQEVAIGTNDSSTPAVSL